MSKRSRGSKSAVNTGSRGLQASQSTNFGRLFKTPEQLENFLQNYFNRIVIPPKYGDTTLFLNFNFPEVFRRNRLDDFIFESGSYYPILVKAFYATLEREGDVLRAFVKGVKIKLTMSKFSEILRLPKEGAQLTPSGPCPLNNYNKMNFYYSLCRFSEAEICARRLEEAEQRGRTILHVGNMTVDNRMLHYFIVYVLVPKASNHAQAQDLDLQIMHALLSNQPVNWSFLILDQLHKQTSRKGGLIYARIISRILEHFQVDLSDEVSIEMTESVNEINRQSLGKLDVIWNNTTKEWVHKSGNQNPPAPIVIPDISSRPSTFAAGSSSTQTPNVAASGSEVTSQMLWDFMQQMNLNINGLRSEVRDGFSKMDSRMNALESRFMDGSASTREDDDDDDDNDDEDDDADDDMNDD